MLNNNANNARSLEAEPSKTCTCYHAGPLFSTAELQYNFQLATDIAQLSCGKLIANLPQDHDELNATAHNIRDNDIHALLGADLALFTFDNTDPNSGTSLNS